MATFKALNLESDDESDVEVDDTKELQIEEALKLYQNALKLHSEGPDFFDQAAEAYEQLFKSDIFEYPESRTELQRVDLYGIAASYDEVWIDGPAGLPAVATGGVESSPSTLHQILHLSHKNYALFKLDFLNIRLESLNISLAELLSNATAALEHFVEALDKDDSDMDLWRRTADVGTMLRTDRVTRFCLETVLEGDEEGLAKFLTTPGLEESLAAERLKDLIHSLSDQLSLLQISSSLSNTKTLSGMLKQRLERQIKDLRSHRHLEAREDSRDSPLPNKVSLEPPETWAGLANTLLQQQIKAQKAFSANGHGAVISFDLSKVTESPTGKTTVPRSELTDEPESMAVERRSARKSSQQHSPDLDKAQFNAELQITSAGSMPTNNESEARQDDNLVIAEPTTMTILTRKRSGDAAGMTDSVEEGRAKSKRTRTRDSTLAEDSKKALMEANSRWEYEQKLNEFQSADDWMFETVQNLFEKITVWGFEASKNVRNDLQETVAAIKGNEEYAKEISGMKLARCELDNFFRDYSDTLGTLLIAQNENLESGQGSHMMRFGGPPGNSNSTTSSRAPLMPEDGLLEFLDSVNLGSLLLHEIALEWLFRLLRPQTPNHRGNTYVQYQWTEDLKTMVVRMLVNFDGSVFERTQQLVEAWKEQLDRISGCSDYGLAEMIETIFEIHLDIYHLIKQPNSGVESETITAQSDRLQRWSILAREAMYFYAVQAATPNLKDDLNLRFLWSNTFNLSGAVDVDQDHVIECMNDLRAIFQNAGEPVLRLQNNAVMPELSMASLSREISRLTTKDFFLKVTSKELDDPAAVIESLEPLLESLDVFDDGAESSQKHLPGSQRPTKSTELSRYILTSDVSVRVLLWQRLRDAYEAIEYQPMVLWCYFRTIKVILEDMKATIPLRSTGTDRQAIILKSIGSIKVFTSKSLALLRSNGDAFECIDEQSLKSAASTYAELLQLIQVFNIFEDSLRAGQNQPPSFPNGSATATFSKVQTQLHDLQVDIWLILYSFLKEAISQFSDLFPSPDEDKFDFLRTVHRNLGLRGICGSSNRAFVRMMKDELFQMTQVESYESEQAQVLYDLYGLNCFIDGNYELIEHDCTHDAFLDRGVALQTIDLLLLQASKLPVKDLVKHDLKDTIEKVHGSVPRKKPTETIIANREVYRAFLRSPINPMDLYESLRGLGNYLDISPIPKEDAPLAAKGWYFLMGHMALTKFRSQKRIAPTPTEDVDIAVAFFMQDLEYSMDNWETWFRLGQAYDTKTEESIVWSAEKLNNNMGEIVQLQRATIHCYTMATALAQRSADLTPETLEKLDELYYDFALRIYSSTREPFSMSCFAVEEDGKFLNLPTGIGKGKAFHSLKPYTAWKISKTLFQRSSNGKSRSWVIHYMIGKCLWKMHQRRGLEKLQDTVPTSEDVIATFQAAIEMTPEKKDTREKREPTLEPHYKLVSIVHKLYKREEISLEQAREALNHTPYSRAAIFPEKSEDWDRFALTILRNLRIADKSNWHHRIVARVAHIIYDCTDVSRQDGNTDAESNAVGAKNELTPQMFTKTMVLQVWRPECERAGRHFVYTARYTQFFVHILERLKDRGNLEMLARRVRRRPHDVFEHTLIWQDICNAYLRLLREHATLPEGLETSTFSNLPHEEFTNRKESLGNWMQAQDTGSYPALDVLREVQELKKINQSLMKPAPIDDLIGDSYAFLFATIGKKLSDEKHRLKEEEEDDDDDEQGRVEREMKHVTPVVSPPRNAMMALTHLINVDGNSGSAAASLPAPTAAPVPAPAVGPTPSLQVPAPPAATRAPQSSLPSTGQHEQVQPRRKVGVGRREIRACAENCFQKVGAVAATSVAKAGSTLPKVQVVIESHRAGGAGNDSVDTSAPGSIHDSADDESELSELEEEEEEEVDDGNEGGNPRPVFPGLASQRESQKQLKEVQLRTQQSQDTNVQEEEREEMGREEDDVEQEERRKEEERERDEVEMAEAEQWKTGPGAGSTAVD